MCRDGVSPQSERLAAELVMTKRRIFEAEVVRLRAGAIHQSPRIQWLNVEDRFTPMGVKMIGVFCQDIREMEFVDPDKYIAGFQVLPNQVPGIGPVEFNQVKVSMRVPPRLERAIVEGRAMGLDTFLPEATGRLGGFSDACHTTCAATTVAIGLQRDLIDGMERILEGAVPS